MPVRDTLAAGVIEEKTQVRQVLTGHELASAVDVERAGVGRMMSVAGAGGADVPMAVWSTVSTSRSA